MTKLATLGRASEITKGTHYASQQTDAPGVKLMFGGVNRSTSDQAQFIVPAAQSQINPS